MDKLTIGDLYQMRWNAELEMLRRYWWIWILLIIAMVIYYARRK